MFLVFLFSLFAPFCKKLHQKLLDDTLYRNTISRNSTPSLLLRSHQHLLAPLCLLRSHQYSLAPLCLLGCFAVDVGRNDGKE